MDKLSELKSILSKQLTWHKSHIDCLIQMLLALVTVRTVNLRELAVAMSSKKTLIASREQRLYRFFAHFEFSIEAISHWIINLFFSRETKFYIAIDRTNWSWGKSPVNIFMISLCYEGIALPFYWKVLKKNGSTSGREQIELVEKVLQLIGTERVEGLLADREFGNKEFISYLTVASIPFYIRIKEDNLTYIKGRKFKKAGQLFPHLKRYTPEVFGMIVEIFDQKLYLTASKNERNELMIVATNKNYKQAISIYLRRWEVECLFQSLKGRGFRFEETHMTKPERIEKMIGILAIAFVWAHKIGEWQAVKKPIRLKKLKTFLTTQKRPAYSLFRYGFDIIRDAITGFTINWGLLKKTFKLLDFNPIGAIL